MLETAVLFVDLVASSEFASVLGLREYAEYVDSFEQVCREHGVPYHDHPTFWSAIVSHYVWLREMGRPPAETAAAG